MYKRQSSSCLFPVHWETCSACHLFEHNFFATEKYISLAASVSPFGWRDETASQEPTIVSCKCYSYWAPAAFWYNPARHWCQEFISAVRILLLFASVNANFHSRLERQKWTLTYKISFSLLVDLYFLTYFNNSVKIMKSLQFSLSSFLPESLWTCGNGNLSYYFIIFFLDVNILGTPYGVRLYCNIVYLYGLY